MSSKRKRKWIVALCSEPLPARYVRRKVQQALSKGIEPEPKYRSGKFWTD